MSLNEMPVSLLPEYRGTLLDVAAASIEHGLSNGSPISIVAYEYAEPLRQPRATFVTLRIAERLRGCMGSLQASEPLVVNVARNAHSAAFRDPRFGAIRVQDSER